MSVTVPQQTDPPKIGNSVSYEEITAAAEFEIRRLMTLPVSDVMERRRNAAWAYGVYLGWEKLTQQRRCPSDDERLHRLTRTYEPG